MSKEKMKNYFDRVIEPAVCGKVAQKAWLEDGETDITSQALELDLISNQRISASIYCSDKCILAGVEELKYVFSEPMFKTTVFYTDGAEIMPGSKIVSINGSAYEIFRRIRTVINILQIMSGIATETAKYYKIVGGKITALRKVHPFISLLEKRAVQIGGGMTHRLSLSDGYIIKSFYIDFFAKNNNISIEDSIKQTILLCKEHKIQKQLSYPIEIETRNENEAVTAVLAGADIVMLDNFEPDDAKRVARRLKSINNSVAVEVSGGITLKNVWAYDSDFIDSISTSEITLKARPVDFYFMID